MSLIIRAANFAEFAHAGQKRKYTNRPFVEHPMRVAGRVSMLPTATEVEVAAAWLHDVLEDCDSEPMQNGLRGFPANVLSLVGQLTNTSKVLHPTLPRSERKKLDRERLARVSYWAKVIKCIDRTDNLWEMSIAPEMQSERYGGAYVKEFRDFKKVYIPESLLLNNECLGDVPQYLRDELVAACKELI